MLSGTLDTFSVAEILELVGASGATGALRVRSDADEGFVRCQDGAVTFATVGADSDLGSVLVRGGFVPEDEWSSIIDSAQPATQLVGILERDAVDANRLQRYIATQTEESVFELDCWRTGDVRLEVDRDGDIADLFRYPTSELLASVAARKREWSGVLDTLGSPDRIVHQAEMGVDDDAEMRVSRSQLVLLSRIDGRHSVREIARLLGTGLFHTCRLVAALVDDGLVVLSEERVSGESVPPVPAASIPPSPPPPPPPPEAPASAPADAGPPETTSEFVEAGDGPARDLIVRLLSAVKEEL